MIPTDNFFIGGGSTETTITPVAMALLGLAIALMLALPRRYVVVPLLLAAFLVPTGNVLVMGGFHLMPTRLLALVGCGRMLMTKPFPGESRFAGGWNGIDGALLAWGIVTAIAVTIQWMTVSALTNQIGVLSGTFGIYFLVRHLVRDDRDIAITVRVLIAVAAVNTLGMVIEQLTLHNLFGTMIGGVQSWPLVREGKIRAEGAFQHAILAGVFGATLLPLCLWLFKTRKGPFFAVLGVVAATTMTLLSASSTPVMAYGGAIFAICLWPIRRNMRMLRWGLSLVLTALHLVMKAPVWFLIARVDVIGGSASFDRANLIDTCIRHFSDWWLWGTHDTGNWGWSMWDLSNQFVSVAEAGGLLALVCFIMIISRSFGRLGVARRTATEDRKGEWCLWFLGAALYAHIMAYFGVSYFDQTQVTWFVLLSIIIAATGPQTMDPVSMALEPEDDLECTKLGSFQGTLGAGGWALSNVVTQKVWTD
jgi:hypothetical protein